MNRSCNAPVLHAWVCRVNKHVKATSIQRKMLYIKLSRIQSASIINKSLGTVDRHLPQGHSR